MTDTASILYHYISLLGLLWPVSVRVTVEEICLHQTFTEMITPAVVMCIVHRLHIPCPVRLELYRLLTRWQHYMFGKSHTGSICSAFTILITSEVVTWIGCTLHQQCNVRLELHILLTRWQHYVFCKWCTRSCICYEFTQIIILAVVT